MIEKKIETATLATQYGEIVCVWRIDDSRPKILRIFLSNPESGDIIRRSASLIQHHYYPTAVPGTNKQITGILDDITDFLHGIPVKFTHELLDFDGCWSQQSSIIRIEAGISRGRITTYTQLANACGIIHGARVVARALAQNPFPLIIPCHRTVRKDGDLGGYQGGLAMKRVLLENEGIHCQMTENLQKTTQSYRIADWSQVMNSPVFEKFGSNK